MADSLITTDDLGDYLSYGLSEDPKADLAVAAASAVICTLAEQTILEVVDDEIILDGAGTDALVLPELPVTDVDSVMVASVEVTDYVTASSGVLIRTPGIWPYGRQNVAVTYTHGYADDELPNDLRMVALNLAARVYSQGIVSSETVGAQYQVNYASPSLDLTPGEKAIVAKYRQVKQAFSLVVPSS